MTKMFKIIYQKQEAKTQNKTEKKIKRQVFNNINLDHPKNIYM